MTTVTVWAEQNNPEVGERIEGIAECTDTPVLEVIADSPTEPAQWPTLFVLNPLGADQPEDTVPAAGWDRARCTALVLTPSTLPICVSERP